MRREPPTPDGQKVMEGHAWWLETECFERSCTVNSGRSVGGHDGADRSQSIHSSEETDESRWSEGMQESEIAERTGR